MYGAPCLVYGTSCLISPLEYFSRDFLNGIRHAHASTMHDCTDSVPPGCPAFLLLLSAVFSASLAFKCIDLI